jgi:hypothetical protein
MIHYKKFPFAELQGNYQTGPSRIPVLNQTHTIQTYPSRFLNRDFCITVKSIRGSIVSTVTSIYTGRSGVQIFAEAIELSLLQNIHTRFSTHTASNAMKTKGFYLAVK